MKLVAVTALLAAVAFGAPRTMDMDTIVPESLVQSGTSMSVESLQKQFEELKASVEGTESATPGVIKVINDMVALIDSEIFVAINDAHKADQTTLNTKMDSIQDLNNVYTSHVKLLTEEKDRIELEITDAIQKSAIWKGKSEEFTASEIHYLHVYDNKTETCCRQTNAGVIDVEYTPAFATCDYTVPAGLKCGERAIKAAVDIVTTPFTDGLALYRALVFACNTLKVDLAAADQACEDAFGACDTAKQNTKSAETETEAEKVSWSGRWDQTISEYNGNYTSMMADYDTTKARVVKDVSDRKKEWPAVETIKCMLLNYRDGGTFDNAAHAKCNKDINVTDKLNIGYPTVVKQLSWEKHVFTEFTDASEYESTCDARKPAPPFTCTVAEPNPTPVCTDHFEEVLN